MCVHKGKQELLKKIYTINGETQQKSIILEEVAGHCFTFGGHILELQYF
jgi:hypothetical protein